MDYLAAQIYEDQRREITVLNAQVPNPLIETVQQAFRLYGPKYGFLPHEEGIHLTMYYEPHHPYIGQKDATFGVFSPPKPLSYDKPVAILSNRAREGSSLDVGFQTLAVYGWNILLTNVKQGFTDTLADGGFQLHIGTLQPS